MVGLLLLPVPAMFLYAFFRLPLGSAITGSWLGLTGLSVVALAARRAKLQWSDGPAPEAIALILATLVFLATNAATVMGGAPAVLVMDGSDQLGYAQVADWLLRHGASQPPVLDPNQPYQSWPYNGVHEGRFGAYLLAAATTVLTGRSPLMSLDLSCGIVLAAGIIGAAAALTRRWPGFALVALAFSAALWFDHSRTGYFGKTIAYPGLLVFLGFLDRYRLFPTGWRTLLLTVLLLGLSTTFNHLGFVSALTMALVGMLVAAALMSGVAAARGRGFAPPPEVLREVGVVAPVLVVAVLVLFASAGGLSAIWFFDPPPPLEIPQWRVPTVGWDLDDHGMPMVDALLAPRLIAASLALSLLVAAIAIGRRQALAGGLIIGPVLMFLALWRVNQSWTLFQLGGVIYPLTVAGTALVLGSLSREVEDFGRLSLGWVVVAALALGVGLREPRLRGAIDRFASHPPAVQQFPQADLEAIIARVRPGPVLITVSDVVPLLVAVVELGRLDIPMRFSEPAWTRFVGYRGWPHRPEATPSPLTLQAAGEPVPPGARVLVATRQYTLVIPAP